MVAMKVSDETGEPSVQNVPKSGSLGITSDRVHAYLHSQRPCLRQASEALVLLVIYLRSG